jgi:hypothetical protein
LWMVSRTRSGASAHCANLLVLMACCGTVVVPAAVGCRCTLVPVGSLPRPRDR